MKRIVLPLLALIFFSCFIIKAQEREKFDPKRNPAVDLKTAIKTASKENKKILLDVGGEWCIWCHKIDKFILANKEVNDFLHSNYVVIKVNYSKDNENKKFFSKYPKVPGYPHFFVLDKRGKLLKSQDTGELEQEKSYSKEKLLNFLRKYAK